MNCQGPCLIHCYYKNSLILLLIGFILGIIISNILSKNREFKKYNLF